MYLWCLNAFYKCEQFLLNFNYFDRITVIHSKTPFERPSWWGANSSWKATENIYLNIKVLIFYLWREANPLERPYFWHKRGGLTREVSLYTLICEHNKNLTIEISQTHLLHSYRAEWWSYSHKKRTTTSSTRCWPGWPRRKEVRAGVHELWPLLLQAEWQPTQVLVLHSMEVCGFFWNGLGVYMIYRIHISYG